MKCFHAYLVEIFTDEGITGIGESWFYAGVTHWEKYLETYVKPFLLQEIVDPCHIEKFVSHFRVKPPGAAISPRPGCIEMALWDIVGKKAGLPVYKLLGGDNNKIKAYASTLEEYPLYTVGKWVKFVRGIYDGGFKAVKLHIGGIGEDPQKYILDVVKGIRDDLGDQIEIMVDAMQAWVPRPYTFRSALKLARGLEEHNATWLEEPLPNLNNPDLSARLCDTADIEIAGGGSLFGWPAYKSLLERGALDIVQPDVAFVGGISEVQKIALLAEAYGRRCIPHFFALGIGMAATLHACSVVRSPYVECPHHPPYITDEITNALLEEPIKIDKEGYIHVPEGPGLGVALKESWKNYLVK
jgi:L-alanine-DL-glutamate epimerase-like enolase superfamily enzyme